VKGSAWQCRGSVGLCGAALARVTEGLLPLNKN